MTPAAREAANRYIDAFIDDGRCEFMTAFADPFPTDVFLNAIDLPAADAPKFVRWVRAVFGGLSGQEQDAGADAQAEIRDYFKSMYDRRRTDPEDLEVDISPICCHAQIDGEPIPEDDLLKWRSCSCWPVSTPPRANSATTSTTSRPIPRIARRLVADPSLMPTAIEELLRFHAFVPPARKLKHDVEYEGCPMKQGRWC